MAIQTEELIERRNLRRKLTFWRVAAFAIVALAVIFGAVWTFDGGAAGRNVAHIAKVKIQGTITLDEELLERLDAIRESDAVKGVILNISSPGGTTAGGEAIYESVRRLADAKPVVAQVDTLAASAGYMIAIASDQVIARQSSIVGSIGVLVQFPNVSGLMDKLGVTLDEVKSSPLKAEPSPFNPTTEPERAMMRSMIMDSYDWFVGLVDERRPLNRQEVLTLADGSVFTGRQALQNKLIDGLGGEQEAIAWLHGKGLGPELKVVEWEPPAANSSWFGLGAAARLAAMLGLREPITGIMGELGADRMFLDGLVSIWQPDTSTARQK